ncbi:MAG: HAD family phosphatase [Chlamydiales bacterium]|nr:HAD family phosphatase [Chlamydiales bacterium]
MKKQLAQLLIGIFLVLPPLSATLSTPYSNQIEAVIFDCDGVLVDTEYLKFLAWKEALAAEHIDYTIEEYMPMVGHSSKNILAMICKLKGAEIPEQVIDQKNGIYQSLQKKGVPPLLEMIAFAKRISDTRHEHKIKVGLASSASQEEILQNLTQIGLENAFDLIISGHDDLDDYVDAEGKNKPKPYIYIEAAKRLHVSPDKCLVFEDTTAGIEAAYSTGMIAIGVPNQFTLNQDFSKATDVIDNISLLALKFAKVG